MAGGPSAKSLRFGDLLKEHRLAAGFSQEHLADVARISVNAIGALERGIRLAPYRATVNLLAEALELDDDARGELEAAASRARARSRTDVKTTGPAHSLPPSRTSFVGREADLKRLPGFVLTQKARMITITGTGGVGKSRLAIEAAREMAGDFAEGIWFVELAHVTDPGLVPNAIASVLGIAIRDDRPAIEALGQALRRRNLLLILDNCEHVLASARRVSRALESACPGVVIVATSREALSLPSELIYALGPLAVPPQGVRSIEEALNFPAVALFARRAAALGVGVFDLTDTTLPATLDIVRRLDGLPLAIELAVPKLRALSAQELSTGLRDRFKLLVDDKQTEVPHHDTLWALIDWSYEKLTDQERFVFESCSVFVGAFTIDAIVAVAARDPHKDTTIYQAFTSIVAKSLVVVVGKAEQRYEMLESVREYASQKARDADRIDALRRRHAEHYLNVARRIHDAQELVPHSLSLKQFHADGLHFEAAITWSLDEGADYELGARLCAALILFLHEKDARLRHSVFVALEHLDADRSPQIFAALVSSIELLFPYRRDPGQCIPDMERAIEISRSAGNTLDLITALGRLALIQQRLGNASAASRFAAEAVSLARNTAAPRRLAWTLHLQAKTCIWNDPERAARILREALECHNPLDADSLVALTLSLLAEIEYRAGRVAIARDLLNRAVTLLRLEPSQNQLTRATCLGEYAAYALVLGEISMAREAAREALRIHLDFGDGMLTSFAIQHLALASALLGHTRRAVLLLGYCMQATASLSDAELGIDKGFRERIMAVASLRLAPPVIDELLRTGGLWDEDKAVEEAFRI